MTARKANQEPAVVKDQPDPEPQDEATPLDKARGALELAKEADSLSLQRQECVQIATAQAAIATATALEKILELLSP